MIKISNLNKENMEDAISFIFKMSKCDDYCGSPKITSIEGAEKLIKSALDSKKEVVVAWKENIILCIIVINKDDLYIQLDGGIFSNDKTLVSQRACLEYILNNYKNCTIDCDQSRNNLANALLEELKFSVIDDATIFKKSDRIDLEVECSFEILKENDFNAYVQFHEKHFEGFYWSFDRIKRDIKMWDIYVLKKDNNIVAACFVAVWRKDIDEIYGIAADQNYYTTNVLKGVLTKVLNKTVDKGKELWIAVERSEELLEDLCNNLEFDINHSYKNYRINS